MEILFSNSLIIHIVISLPERPILVRWMSLETQWKTSWKPHAFRNDFKPVCKLFLNLHIQKARRKHGHQQIYLFTHNNMRANYDNESNTTAPFVWCIEEIEIQVCILFLHESTYSAHNLIYGSGWVSFLWWFSNFLDKLCHWGSKHPFQATEIPRTELCADRNF